MPPNVFNNILFLSFNKILLATMPTQLLAFHIVHGYSWNCCCSGEQAAHRWAPRRSSLNEAEFHLAWKYELGLKVWMNWIGISVVSPSSVWPQLLALMFKGYMILQSEIFCGLQATSPHSNENRAASVRNFYLFHIVLYKTFRFHTISLLVSLESKSWFKKLWTVQWMLFHLVLIPINEG